VSTDGDVLHFVRPGGWHCLMNFGDAPAPLPAGQVVLSSSTSPVVDELPGETTVWITPPRPS
jgi:alpha-glucosidase